MTIEKKKVTMTRIRLRKKNGKKKEIGINGINAVGSTMSGTTSITPPMDGMTMKKKKPNLIFLSTMKIRLPTSLKTDSSLPPKQLSTMSTYRIRRAMMNMLRQRSISPQLVTHLQKHV